MSNNTTPDPIAEGLIAISLQFVRMRAENDKLRADLAEREREIARLREELADSNAELAVLCAAMKDEP